MISCRERDSLLDRYNTMLRRYSAVYEEFLRNRSGAGTVVSPDGFDTALMACKGVRQSLAEHVTTHGCAELQV
jgi:hypothetical protein